jgi:carbonic anhydrase
MNRRHLLKGLAGFASCALCARAGFAAEEAHWSYEGASGPDHWGDIDTASKVCSVGSQQSPVDIADPIRAQLPPLGIAWRRRADTIVNNGHTVQVNLGESSTLTVGSDRFVLVQFHFHRPSEHRLDRRSFAMEVHFVHRHATGRLAVVGVLINPGRANAAFNKLVATMPAKEGPPVPADPGIDPTGLLPERRSYFRYQGSLTTPPCSETVDWLLLTQPIQVADADIAAFAKLYPNNARPVQRLHRRFVLRSG